MRIDKVYIKEFKNLKEFSVELDTEQLTNVFIGKTVRESQTLLRR